MKLPEANVLVRKLINSLKSDEALAPCKEEEIIPAFETLLIRNEGIEKIVKYLQQEMIDEKALNSPCVSISTVRSACDQLNTLTERKDPIENFITLKTAAQESLHELHRTIGPDVAKYLQLDFERMSWVEYTFTDCIIYVEFDYDTFPTRQKLSMQRKMLGKMN